MHNLKQSVLSTVEAILRGWSEKFSASTIDGNTIGKIFL